MSRHEIRIEARPEKGGEKRQIFVQAPLVEDNNHSQAIAEAMEMWGPEVVFTHLMKSVTIQAQQDIRAIETWTKDTAEKDFHDWKPYVGRRTDPNSAINNTKREIKKLADKLGLSVEDTLRMLQGG